MNAQEQQNRAVDEFHHFGIVPVRRSGSGRHTGMADSTQRDFFGVPFTIHSSEGRGRVDLFNADGAEHSGMLTAVRLRHACTPVALARSQEMFAVSNRAANNLLNGTPFRHHGARSANGLTIKERTGSGITKFVRALQCAKKNKTALCTTS